MKRKKVESLSACGSLRGEVFAWVKDPAGIDKKVYLNTWSKLETFCERSLNVKLDNFILDNLQE